MPPELGYFHPDKEKNFEWCVRRDVLHRSTYRHTDEIYEEVAKARDEAALAAMETGNNVGADQIEAESNRLRLIAGELRQYFETHADIGVVCLFVDDYESDLLAGAESYYYSELVPRPQS